MTTFYRGVFIVGLIVPSICELVHIRFSHPMDLTELDGLMLIALALGVVGMIALDIRQTLHRLAQQG
jgi:hypothetical protein